MEDKIDGFTSASKNFFYEKSSLKGAALLDTLKNRQGAVFLSTVNPDNSPNLAVIIPGVYQTETLYFHLAENQTRENILRGKKALLGVYLYDATATDKYQRNQGGKIQLSLIEDDILLQQLQKATNESSSTIFMKIESFLPLG